jgi:hypothetical protein
MEQLPNYISIVFVFTALLTAVLLYKATNYSKGVITITAIWLALQAVLGLSGFYTVTTGLPPRFALVILPPVIFIAVIFLTKKGKDAIDSFDVKMLTLLHIVRIPVELTLYWLFLHKAVPQIMTFEGRNFDVFCGLTVPVIYYFAYIKNVFGKTVLMLWNIACLLLLTNIVITAVLSTPLRFQQFGFEQPNIALFYFPLVWLPAFVVPTVLFAHLVSIRRLMKNSAS